MTNSQIELLWENYRDGQATESERAAFEAYLQANPQQANLFEAETQWLSSLAEMSQVADPPFASAVVDQWVHEDQPAVVGRIHWRGALFPLGSMAAAAAVAFAMWLSQTPSEPVDFNSPLLLDQPIAAHQPPMAAASFGTLHPLTSLMRDVSEAYEQEPDHLARAFEQARRLMDFDQLASSIEVTPIQTVSYQGAPE